MSHARPARSLTRLVFPAAALLSSVLLLHACAGGAAPDTFQTPTTHFDAGTCAAGLALCNGKCTNLMIDSANCGRCASACTNGATCVAGMCKSAGGGCPNGQTKCGSACVDLTRDAANCGACGAACNVGESCEMGQCTGPAQTCPPGQIACGNQCTDVTSDAANCGACGAACNPGEVCQASSCLPGGNNNPDAGGGGGGGGVAGCGATVTCLNGCPQGDAACEQGCVDAASPTAQKLLNDVFTCLDGACPSTGGGVCDSKSKNYNPAACNLCYQTAQSKGGKCAAQINACIADKGGGGGGCPQGQTSCNGACTDLTTDKANCGACGNACGPNTTCTAGKCAPICAQGQILCSGKCVDPTTDVANCGGCAQACLQGQTCQAGVCGGGGGGGMTGCNGAVACLNACLTVKCENACVANTTPQGQQLLNALLTCLENSCPSTGGGVCDVNSFFYSAKACSSCYSKAQANGGACYKPLNACLASLP